MPGDVAQIPVEVFPAGTTSVQMMITNFNLETAEVRIYEMYGEDYVMNSGTVAPSMVSIDFVRDPSSDIQPVVYDVRLIGQDKDPNHLVGLVSRGDTAYVYDPCPASTEEYGSGWNGRYGVPILRTDAPPVMGTQLNFEFGNSLQADTSAFWAIGLQKNAVQTALGGMLNVKPLLVLPLALPQQGTSFPYQVPVDPTLCGVSFYHQLFVVDEDASAGLSFSRGLQVTLGN